MLDEAPTGKTLGRQWTDKLQVTVYPLGWSGELPAHPADQLLERFCFECIRDFSAPFPLPALRATLSRLAKEGTSPLLSPSRERARQSYVRIQSKNTLAKSLPRAACGAQLSPAQQEMGDAESVLKGRKRERS
jgi:hypothetical protein